MEKTKAIMNIRIVSGNVVISGNEYDVTVSRFKVVKRLKKKSEAPRGTCPA